MIVLAASIIALSSVSGGQVRGVDAPALEWVTLRPTARPGGAIFAQGAGTQGATGALVSLSELTAWRSPKGLDSRLVGDVLSVKSFDKGAYATIELSSGRVRTAGGSLSSLRGKRLKRVVVPNGGGMAFGTGRIDFLVSYDALKAYFRGWAIRSDSGLSLRFSPVSVSETMFPTPIADQILTVEFVPVDVALDGVRIQIGAAVLSVYVAKGKPIRSILRYKADFSNSSDKSVAVQPWQLVPPFEASLGVVMHSPRFPSVMSEGGGSSFERQSRKSVSAVPASYVLERGDRATFMAKALIQDVELQDIRNDPVDIRLEYRDEARRIVIGLQERARDVDKLRGFMAGTDQTVFQSMLSGVNRHDCLSLLPPLDAVLSAASWCGLLRHSRDH